MCGQLCVSKVCGIFICKVVRMQDRCHHDMHLSLAGA